MESYGGTSDVPQERASETFDLVIVTNTSVPPSRIRTIVPDFRARHPHARLIVLSGYCPDDFVADLVQKGIHGFLTLPYEQNALLKKVDGLLSMPTP